MKFKNVTKETLSFPMGEESKAVGIATVMDAGEPVRVQRKMSFERIVKVAPGEVIDIEEGYTLTRGGIKERPSYLHEAGLIGKLVAVA